MRVRRSQPTGADRFAVFDDHLRTGVLAEQAFGRRGMAQPREHEVDRGAAGIDGSVEVAPTALDTNVGLIDTPQDLWVGLR